MLIVCSEVPCLPSMATTQLPQSILPPRSRITILEILGEDFACSFMQTIPQRFLNCRGEDSFST